MREVPVFLKVVLRRLQIRLGKRKSMLWFVFWSYLGILAFFSIVGDRGLWRSYLLWREYEKLQNINSDLRKEISELRQDVKLFRNDSRTLERYAREELHLAGKGEIQYIFR